LSPARAREGGRPQRPPVEKLLRYDLIVIDELGYLPFSQSGGQLLFHLISKLYENTSLLITTIWHSPIGRRCSVTPK